jgi:flagellum-specific ATP synthase
MSYRGEKINHKHVQQRNLMGRPLNPLDRSPINESLELGVRSIDSFMTIGKGQRMAIMAGSGVGKSVLMGMIARNTKAQVNVIALIGERGREVLDFIQSDLGEEGLKRSVVIVATSDTSPLIRIKAAYTATTIAEYFRDQGQDVMLMMDSVTRFAMAAREISMSLGEPPGPKGYGPSVFGRLPKLLERAGTLQGKGSITGIYTVLVEGGDFDEPIADAIRSISDGHIVLSRKLAEKNFYPAIDVLGSLSRVMTKVVKREHLIVAAHLRDLMGVYKESEDLINMGAYVKGVNQKLDKAMVIKDDLQEFLKQDVHDSSDLDQCFDALVEIARKAEKAINPEIFDEDQKITAGE